MFTISAASHTQNVPTYKEYTVKLLFKYKHLEYEHNFTMSPVGKYLPIHIVNNVITIKNPNRQHHRFVIDYRIHTFHSPRNGKLPMRIWISQGKHRIEFSKKVWFWHTWIQYAQWTQDFEITTYEPKSSFLAEQPIITTSIFPTTTTNMVVINTTKTQKMVQSPTTINPIQPITSLTITTRSRKIKPETITTAVPKTTTLSLQRVHHPDVNVIRFAGGQILLYLG